MTTLILHLKKEYFKLIKDGFKKVEYREYNDYWKKRLYTDYPAGTVRQFEKIILFRGYPAFEEWNESNRIEFPWHGFSIGMVQHHPQFNKGGLTAVFEIPLYR